MTPLENLKKLAKKYKFEDLMAIEHIQSGNDARLSLKKKATKEPYLLIGNRPLSRPLPSSYGSALVVIIATSMIKCDFKGGKL